MLLPPPPTYFEMGSECPQYASMIVCTLRMEDLQLKSVGFFIFTMVTCLIPQVPGYSQATLFLTIVAFDERESVRK